jgi:hypothetical protein
MNAHDAVRVGPVETEFEELMSRFGESVRARSLDS